MFQPIRPPTTNRLIVPKVGGGVTMAAARGIDTPSNTESIPHCDPPVLMPETSVSNQS